jgi:hypothetical protein
MIIQLHFARMRVDESWQALLQGTFQALDEQNKSFMSVPTMF